MTAAAPQQSPAFAAPLALPYVGRSPLLPLAAPPPAASPLRPPQRPRAPRPAASRARGGGAVVAVLDTPASNTYLQQHAEVVLRDFLTRRAVDTQLFYLRELSDMPTHRWLSSFERFADHSASFADGDAFLDRMTAAPVQSGELKVGHPAGRFFRKVHYVVEPARIARRVMDGRVHLAAEWAHDLKLIELENLELQRLSFEKLICTSQRELDAKKNIVYEEDPFSDHSPLRYKNYMALKTLITQHAVARLLPFMRDRGSNHEYMYLLQFVNSHGVIRDGDAFVRDLMARSIELRTNPMFTIQPRAIALQVLEIREAIAEEWIAVMEYVPVEHKAMSRAKLEKAMDASLDLPPPEASEEPDADDV